MIHTLSLESTETPMVWPITQWLGKGFGQKGSTSNLGAIAPPACTTARLLTRTDPAAKSAAKATIVPPTHHFRFIVILLARDTSLALLRVTVPNFITVLVSIQYWHSNVN